MRYLVTGATGFIGKRLLSRLDDPVVLSRDPTRAQAALGNDRVKILAWDAEGDKPPADAFQDVDAVFHLAGEPIAEGRWNADKKRRLRESRVAGTRHLVAAVAALPADRRPKVLVSASAVGYYGDRGDELLTEQTPPADSFLAEICVAWEREAAAARQLGLRVCMPRIGIVLGQGGGALAQMVPAFKSWAGSRLGTGKQYVPWIHLDDLVELLLFCSEQPIEGAVNATAPHPVTNAEFTTALADCLGAPRLLPPVPAFVLRTMLGEFGQVLLHSQRVIPQAAQNAGFTFRFPTITAALNDILKSNKVTKHA